ncbi:MAG: hypothetical protein ACD_19C00127G0002 [uncultured bacterium]|nr:MAG: hypothetical protein ACD_19C00127G0002 [uncultured bacterium]
MSVFSLSILKKFVLYVQLTTVVGSPCTNKPHSQDSIVSCAFTSPTPKKTPKNISPKIKNLKFFIKL